MTQRFELINHFIQYINNEKFKHPNNPIISHIYTFKSSLANTLRC